MVSLFRLSVPGSKLPRKRCQQWQHLRRKPNIGRAIWMACSSGGKQYGISYEGGRAFEKYINQKYSPKTKNLSPHLVFRPVQRDDLFSHSPLGTGTSSMFPPTMSGINEILVTGPDLSVLTSLDDLSGKDTFRRSTSASKRKTRLQSNSMQRQKISKMIAAAAV